jgi:hypothetical protein
MVCNKIKYNPDDYIGKKLGKWTILEEAGLTKHGSKAVKCRCECGTEVIRPLSLLISGSKKLVGCIKCKGIIEDRRDIPIEIYRIWSNMKARCYNPKNSTYAKCGGIGVIVCDEWKNDIHAFYDWARNAGFKLNSKMRVVRLDTNKNFDSDNCRIKHSGDFLAYINKRFGKLVVLSVSNYKNNNSEYMLCQCDCGNTINVKLRDLRNGIIDSCVYCKAGKRYGIRSHRLYRIWRSMRDRCYNYNNGNYHSYGGRGIKICNEWLNSYEVFYDWAMSNAYKEGLSIDRIDVNGNYCPENCRWATSSQQGMNKRKLLSNRSGYTGIIPAVIKNIFFGWRSSITVNNKTKHFGTYKTQKEGLAVRNNYIIMNKLDHPIQEYIGEIGEFTEQDIGKEVKNYKKKPRTNSIYKGVYPVRLYNNWVAVINVNNIHIKIGSYKTQKEALEARNKYIIDNSLDYPIQEYKGEIGSI